MTDLHATTPPTEGGYILLYRRLLKNPAFKSDFEAMVFAWLVMRASWKETRVRYKDRHITLRRGQLAISVRDIAMKMERTRQWAERFLARLQNEDMIETASETGVTVVTIRNYDVYQRRWDSAETPSETASGQDRDTTETQNNKVNKGNKEKEDKHAKRVFVLPDWVDVDAWSDWENHRKEIKKPLTDTARKRCVGTLEEARSKGYSAREVIDRSINGGWQGLFVPDRSRSTMASGQLDEFGMPVAKYTESELKAHTEFMKGVL